MPVFALIASAAIVVVAVFALVVAWFAPAVDLALSLTDIDDPPVHVDAHGAVQAVTLKRHRDDVTLRGTASSDTTVTVRINGDNVASQYIPPGTAASFRMEHVPLPEGWCKLEIEAATWHGFHHDVNRATYTIFDPPPVPFRHVTLATKFADGGNVMLTGTGPPNSTILLYDSVQPRPGKDRADAVELARARTGDGGTFDVWASLPGGAHLLWVATPHCEDLKCTSKAQKIAVDRSIPPPPRFHATRALLLDVGYKRLAVRIEATLPLEDPRARALIDGAPAKSIVGLLYDELRINDQPAEALFAGITPQYAVHRDAVSVTLTSQGQHAVDPILPVIAGPLIISASGSASPATTAWDQDTVRIAFADYRLARPQPAPFRSDEHAVTWDRPFEQDGGRIVTALSFSPWDGAAAFHGLLALPAPELTSDIPARLLGIVDGLPFAIPMLAYLVITRRRARAPLRGAARVLMAVGVSAPVFLALSGFQHEFATRIVRLGMSGLPTDALLTKDLLVPLVSGATFAAIALAVGMIFAGDVRWWAVVVRESLYAIAVAAGIFVLSAMLTFVAHTVSGTVFFTLDPAAVELRWYLVAVTIGIAVGSMIALAPCGFYRASNGGTLPAIVGVIAFASLAAALPLTFAQYIAWADQPAFNGTVFSDVGAPTAVALDYLRQAGVLCNFSFGLALVVLPLIGKRDTGLEPQELLKIGLCCYAVPATASIMLVPVSFLIAWLTFRWILDPEPPTVDECAAIRDKRSALMTEVLLQPRTGDVVAKIQEMTNRFIDGALDKEKLDEARERMRATIDAPGARATEHVFSVAPGTSRNDAARLALFVASVFVVLHVALFLSTQTAALRVAHTAFPILVLGSFIATGAAQFMVPAAAFGWGFESISGRSGLHKAIVVAVWAIGCSLPSWLLRLPSLNSVVALVVETALFYTVLGFAFDIAIVRDAKHSRFRLRDVPALAGGPALSWAGTILLASAGVAISGIVTGHLQSIVTSTITSVYRQATIGQ